MAQLNKAELWERIRQLRGKTVYTLKMRRPNPIAEVTESKIFIRGRKSYIPRQQIEDAYGTLLRDGELYLADKSWQGGNSMWRIAPAIVQAAIPDRVEIVLETGRSGIRFIVASRTR